MSPSPQSLVDAIPQLEDNLPAENFMLHQFWLPVLLGLLAASALAAVALFLYRRRHKQTETEQKPDEIALQELESLENEMPPLRPLSLRLSMILRRFLAGQTQDNSLYETHEEFSLRLDSLSTLPDNCQYDTRVLLEELAALKYAPETEFDPQRGRRFITEARDLVNKITEAWREASLCKQAEANKQAS